MKEFIICLAVFMVLLAIKTAFDDKKKRRERRSYFRNNLGHFPLNETGEAENRLLRRYHENVHPGEGLDDITWHDLGLDAVYARMNTALTLYGEERLYDMLRTPLYDREGLEERDRLISALAKEDDDRAALMLSLGGIGRKETMVLTDCMKELKTLAPGRSPFGMALIDVVCLLLGIFSCILIFIQPMAGFFAFFAVLFFNLCVYFYRKKAIAGYISCFGAILRLIRGTRSRKVSFTEGSTIGEYAGEMRQLAESLSGFTRFSFLLTAGRWAMGSLVDVVMDYFRMYLHLDIIRFYYMLDFALKREEDIMKLAMRAGELDACCAIASYRKSLKRWCRPDLSKEGFRAVGLCHPLISGCVSNDLDTASCVLLTGSNASGKSTFLRSVSLAAVMAQTIYTVNAEEYQAGIFRVATSMSISDDVLSGDSYYMAEIKSIKRIMAWAEDEVRLLCAIDEVLRGTNTAERIAASAEILTRLSKSSLCFAATHDLELATLLEGSFVNYHFTEEVDAKEGDITFSYKLLPGMAQSRNAIRLLSLMGYDGEIVKRAEERCDRFIREGVWK